MAPSTLTPPLAVTTPLGPNKLFLTAFTGTEALSQLFTFQLDLLVENWQDFAFEDLLGQPVTVQLALPGRPPRYFSGLVNRLSQAQRGTHYTAYRAEVVPLLWLLTRRVQSRIFQHMTVPDILKKVLDGLDVTYQIQGKFEPRDFCVQYRESDFAFASRLMEEEGIYYFFTHTADGHQLVLANTVQGHPDLPGGATVIYEDAQGGTREGDRILSWQKSQGLRSGKYTLWDYCFELPQKHLEATVVIPDTLPVGEVTHQLKLAGNDHLEVYDYPGGYAQRFDGVNRGGGDQSGDLQKIFTDNKRTTAIRMLQDALPGLEIQGTSNCCQFVSGHQFTLTRHFNANGPYVLTAVRHAAKVPGNHAGNGSSGFSYTNTFTCIPAALPFGPPARTPRPMLHGTQTAVVVGPQGEEIFTDKYGRVKVQFPWDRRGKYDADSSCWIRVGTTWAGKQWGTLQIPRIGQEVIVAFEEGDPDRPIIVGSVYNAEMMPATKLPDQKMCSGMKSNSTPGGGGYNEISIDDSKGKEKITIHGQYDMNTTVEHDMADTVHNNRQITVDGTYTETIKKDTKIEITEGKLEHKVLAKTADYHVEGAVKETYNATQDTTVRNNITITSTAGGVKLQAPGDEKAVPAGEIVILAGEKITLVTGASSLTMEKTGKITIAGVNVVVTGKADIQESAPKITLTGEKEVTMAVGPQSVTCDPDQVLTSGSAIKATAAGVHEIIGTMVKIN
jgi:type VI secretion system secreted protein VgrG